MTRDITITIYKLTIDPFGYCYYEGPSTVLDRSFEFRARNKNGQFLRKDLSVNYEILYSYRELFWW
jgi:hypothetical protein